MFAVPLMHIAEPIGIHQDLRRLHADRLRDAGETTTPDGTVAVADASVIQKYADGLYRASVVYECDRATLSDNPNATVPESLCGKRFCVMLRATSHKVSLRIVWQRTTIETQVPKNG